MKIGLITVYYTENCGSVLQAYALKCKLNDLGCDVNLISTKNKFSGHSYKRFVKNVIKGLKNRQPISSSVKKFYSYDRFIRKNFKTISPNNISKIDLIVIGSDTVWDVESEYFLASQDLFWGTKYKDIPIISFSASIANSNYQILNEKKYILDALNKMKKISVRDIYTEEYVKYKTDKKIYITCDPTFLYEKEFYVKLCSSVEYENYLLLYLFNEPTQEEKEQILDYAKKHNLKIISLIGMGKYISFADIYVESTVENFLSYYLHAKCVITNTFHGTVFSIIFNKEFVVLDYKKNKINNLLKSVSLETRLNNNNIDEIFKFKIDYSNVNEIISNIRKESIDYLRGSINEK